MGLWLWEALLGWGATRLCILGALGPGGGCLGSPGCGHGHRLQDPRILANGARRRTTKESLSCPGNPCSVPLPLPLGAFASERLKASSAEALEHSNYASF